MAEKIKFNGTGDGISDHGIHFVGSIIDFTLCGLTLDGDPKTCGNYDHTNEKVNCQNCIEIVKDCKKIKCTEMIKIKNKP